MFMNFTFNLHLREVTKGIKKNNENYTSGF